MDIEMPDPEPISLYNSHICRLCAEENSNGYPLFGTDSMEPDLCALINSYLPLKVVDDGNYPRWICPGCHLQVESTVQFFDLVLTGQKTLLSLSEGPCKDQENEENEHCISPENAAAIRASSYLTECFTYHRDLHEKSTETSAPVAANPSQPKRKRGRPPKPPPTEKPQDKQSSDVESETVEEIEQIVQFGCRRRRQIKIPTRYQEAVQGKELEKVYSETGAIEHSDIGSDAEEGIQEITAGGSKYTVYPVEVIGHLQDNGGENLGDLVVVNNKVKKLLKKSKAKKKTRFMCDICKVCFCYEQKFLQHRYSHHNVRFECKQCLANYPERDSLTQHQCETNHTGEGIIEGFEAEHDDSDPTSAETRCIGTYEFEVDKQTADNSILNSSILTDHCNLSKFDEMSDGIDELSETDRTLEEFHRTSVHDAPREDSSEREVNDSLIDELHFHNGRISNSEAHTEELIALSDHDEATRDYSKKHLNYSCSICHRKFNRRQSYIYHKETQHNDGRRFVCSKCRKSFKNKTLLQRHQLVHSNLRPFSCNYCSAAFKTKTHLLYHKRSHTGEKRHQCDICQQFFAHKNSLTLHMRYHTGYKPFKCSVCGKTFTQHGNMQEHMRIHTGECPFECHICGRKFKTSSQVRMHIKRHEVNKPLKCNLCDKTFVQIVELRNHQRRHNNVKPHRCDICGKCFTDIGGVKKHYRLHTGEKPYACTNCPRKFADRSNLKKHLKIHENKRKAIDLLQSVSSDPNMLVNKTVDFTQTSSVDHDSFTLSAADVNSIDGGSLMWDIIEEDVCLENSASALSGTNSTYNSQQLVDITYQDPLLVVQNTCLESMACKMSSLEESSSNDQVLQASNIFLSENNSNENGIQTVILNIQNPVGIKFQQACDLLRNSEESDSELNLVSSQQRKLEIINYTNTLDFPD